jgi:predicted aminopeptidase
MLGGERIDRVLADPTTPPEVAALLGEVAPIRAFGVRNGLTRSRSYRRYVALDREYVVWFVTGSRPLAFEPKVYWFPIAGSFAGVGWFRQARADRHVARLERRGWDAAARGASAYSTAGWFRDPVVSSMLSTGPAAPGELANVLLHESLHATVLVPNQTTFDESLASFVADTMTLEYLTERFGATSPELRAYRDADAAWRRRQARELAAYEALAALYASPLPDAEKLREKRELLAALDRDLGSTEPANNASLLGAKLYGTGQEDFAALLSTCGHDWPRFLAAVSSLRPRDFAARQQQDVASVAQTLVRWGCEPLR